jgi:hypothetical protein
MKSNIIGTKLLDENIDMDEIMFMTNIWKFNDAMKLTTKMQLE